MTPEQRRRILADLAASGDEEQKRLAREMADKTDEEEEDAGEGRGEATVRYVTVHQSKPPRPEPGDRVLKIRPHPDVPGRWVVAKAGRGNEVYLVPHPRRPGVWIVHPDDEERVVENEGDGNGTDTA